MTITRRDLMTQGLAAAAVGAVAVPALATSAVALPEIAAGNFRWFKGAAGMIAANEKLLDEFRAAKTVWWTEVRLPRGTIDWKLFLYDDVELQHFSAIVEAPGRRLGEEIPAMQVETEFWPVVREGFVPASWWKAAGSSWRGTIVARAGEKPTTIIRLDSTAGAEAPPMRGSSSSTYTGTLHGRASGPSRGHLDDATLYTSREFGPQDFTDATKETRWLTE